MRYGHRSRLLLLCCVPIAAILPFRVSIRYCYMGHVSDDIHQPYPRNLLTIVNIFTYYITTSHPTLQGIVILEI